MKKLILAPLAILALAAIPACNRPSYDSTERARADAEAVALASALGIPDKRTPRPAAPGGA